MKKTFILAIVLMMIISTYSVSFANEPPKEIKEEFNLIEYLENNELGSIAELEEIILEKSTNDEVLKSINTVAVKAITRKLDKVEEFTIEIDKENELLYVTEIVSSEIEVPKMFERTVELARSTIYSKRSTSTQSAYSWAGVKIFSVITEGRFEYDKSSYCKVIDSEGYFVEPFLGLWNSVCSVSDRDLGTTAYVKTYGTANLNLGIAEIFGINLNFQTCRYNLQLTCDRYGSVSTSWDLEKL